MTLDVPVGQVHAPPPLPAGGAEIREISDIPDLEAASRLLGHVGTLRRMPSQVRSLNQHTASTSDAASTIGLRSASSRGDPKPRPPTFRRTIGQWEQSAIG